MRGARVRGSILGWILGGAGAVAMVSPEARAENPCAGKQTVPERVRCGNERFEREDFVGAAEVFEALWRESGTGQPSFLFNASAAREAGGSDGWALALALEYAQQPGLTAREIDEASERVRELRSRLTRVPIEIVPLAALGEAATWTFRRVKDGVTEEFSYPTSRLLTRDGLAVWLERGDWSLVLKTASPSPAYAREHTSVWRVGGGTHDKIELRPTETFVTFRLQPASEVRRGADLRLIDLAKISADRGQRVRDGQRIRLPLGSWGVLAKQRRLSPWTIEGRFEVLAAEASGEVNTVSLEWKITPRQAARRRRQIEVIQGLCGAGAGAGVVGVATLIGGLATLDHGDGHDWRVPAAGGGMLGSGAGLAVAGALESLERSPTRTALTLVSGSGLTVVGALWHAAAAGSFEGDPEGKATLGSASAALLGAGVGMVAGAVLGHLLRRDPRTPARARLGLDMTTAMVVVHGRL